VVPLTRYGFRLVTSLLFCCRNRDRLDASWRGRMHRAQTPA